MVHMYIVTNTTIFLIESFTITKVQLHVSAINVGHLQVVHEALNDKLYLHVNPPLKFRYSLSLSASCTT